MKTLYYTYCQSGYGTFFYDEKLNLVSFLHEGDGNYRKEYMYFIPKFFGGQIIEINIDMSTLNYDDDYDDYEDRFEAMKTILSKHIKNFKKQK